MYHRPLIRERHKKVRHEKSTTKKVCQSPLARAIANMQWTEFTNTVKDLVRQSSVPAGDLIVVPGVQQTFINVDPNPVALCVICTWKIRVGISSISVAHVCMKVDEVFVCLAKIYYNGAPDEAKVDYIPYTRELKQMLGSGPLFRVLWTDHCTFVHGSNTYPDYKPAHLFHGIAIPVEHRPAPFQLQCSLVGKPATGFRFEYGSGDIVDFGVPGIISKATRIGWILPNLVLYLVQCVSAGAKTSWVFGAGVCDKRRYRVLLEAVSPEDSVYVLPGSRSILRFCKDGRVLRAQLVVGHESQIQCSWGSTRDVHELGVFCQF